MPGQRSTIRSVLPGSSLLKYGRYRLLLRPSELFVYYATFVAGEYDFLHLEEGDLVLDAGANIGDFSIVASRAVGASGCVVAVEPEPSNFHMLLANLKANDAFNVIPLQLALSDADGESCLAGGFQGAFLSASGETRVLTRTMDSILRETGLRSFDVVKMDIEGGEEAVFRDDRWLRGVREIVVEIHGLQEFLLVTQSLRRHGFVVSTFGNIELITNVARNSLRHAMDVIRAEIRSGGLALRGVLNAALTGRRHPIPSCRGTGNYRLVRGRRG